MFRVFFAFFFVMTMPIAATITTSSSAPAVLLNGDHEQVSGITLTFDNGADIPAASAANPFFLRLQLPNGVTLADTQVWSHPSNLGQANDGPIYLPLVMTANGNFYVVEAMPTTAAIVRWKAGEDAIWLRFTAPSSEWLTDHMNTLPVDPDHPMQLRLGIAASIYWNQAHYAYMVGEASHQTATRSADINVSEADAMSTHLCLNISSGSLMLGQTYDYNLSGWRDMAVSGSNSPAEAFDAADISLGTAQMLDVAGATPLFQTVQATPQMQTQSTPSQLFDPGVGLTAHSHAFTVSLTQMAHQNAWLPGSRLDVRLDPIASQGLAVAVDGANQPIDYNTVDASVPPGTRYVVQGLSAAGFAPAWANVADTYQLDNQWVTRAASLPYQGAPIVEPAQFTVQTDLWLSTPLAGQPLSYQVQAFAISAADRLGNPPFDGAAQRPNCPGSLMATSPASVPFANGVLSSVPTLGAWALIAFVILLMALALWFNRTQRFVSKP